MEIQDKEVQFWDFQSLKEIPLPVTCMKDVLVIYAKENKIAAVPQNMFDYFPNLCELHVGGNEIKEVPADLFERLYTLTLPNNRLNRLPNFGIVSISLMRLDISKNKITELPKCFGT